MAEVIFNIDDNFRRIALHAEQHGKPIHFVHDDGVYLCTPELRAEEGSERRLCVYAQGCNPTSDPDFYDTARDLVGGDDFAERFDGADRMIFAKAAREGCARMIFEVSETHLNIRAE